MKIGQYLAKIWTRI